MIRVEIDPIVLEDDSIQYKVRSIVHKTYSIMHTPSQISANIIWHKSRY